MIHVLRTLPNTFAVLVAKGKQTRKQQLRKFVAGFSRIQRWEIVNNDELSSDASILLVVGVVGFPNELRLEYTGIGLFSLLGSQLTSQITWSRLSGVERDSKVTKGGMCLGPR